MIRDRSAEARAEWQTCRAKTLCRRGPGRVTGADIVRISRTLALEPWHFTQAAPATADDPAGIVLDRGRRRVLLTIANAQHGCVFSINTPSGAHCCGLGDLAPISCRIFPVVTSDIGVPAIHPESGCDGREWTLDDLNPALLTAAMRAGVADRERWFELVRAWNERAAESEDELSVEDFQRYLLEEETGRPKEATA